MANFGKMLVVAGILIAMAGALLWLGQRVPWLRLGRLPGDIVYERNGFSIHVPIVTMLLLSLILSAVLWLIGHWRR